MGDPKTVLEGGVKYRDKKKWKSRWAVVSKLSPVADCLHIQLYRDSKERCRNGPTKASLSLEAFQAMETGFTLDKESNTLALVCSDLSVVLAFDSREVLIQWQVKIRANLVEEQQFLVQLTHVPTRSKLPSGPARLHLQDHSFCLVSGVPPRLLAAWPIKELRRFGVVEGKFCFEGGSLCGKGEGLHVLLTNQSEELSQAMDLASKGRLQGKRKTLSRKNSVLETSSSRMPLHKRCHLDSTRSDTPDSHRRLLSSGSECSTCDACSEILRDPDDPMYAPSNLSMKASSCRIHYRWPSCLSRWGQSSTTTASDIDSVDTVSIILSDLQASTSATMCNSTHGQSLSCLCDSQSVWPFKQCTKCDRQIYNRGSLHSRCSLHKPESPEPALEEANGFSPQWTMDSVVGSSGIPLKSCKKDSTYQLMNPLFDRTSLCSHASHSSSASAASSSGSEYSVPKNFLENLYDKPKNMQYSLNGFSGDKPGIDSNDLCLDHKTRSLKSTDKQDCVLSKNLPCAQPNTDMTNGRRSASANASPSSSPKKSKYNTASKAVNNGTTDSDLQCLCRKEDPFNNYSIPRSAITRAKSVSSASAHTNGKNRKNCKPSVPAEDYDVPKKFTDILSNCDMFQKSNGPSCSCVSNIVQNIELFKMATKHPSCGQKLNPALQMCACQRVMLWAGSMMPCMGPQRPPLEHGWQCASNAKDICQKGWLGHTAVCIEPHKTAEAVMTNGKVKHVIKDSSCSNVDQNIKSQVSRPRANTVSYSLSANHSDSDSSSSNYTNIEFKAEKKVTDDSSTTNYANMDFAESLSLYENSNMVLSRIDSDPKSDPVCHDKPPLPPRTHTSSSNQSTANHSDTKDKCKCKQMFARKSPRSKRPQQPNGGAYEMMSYEKDASYDVPDEDYLLMQPLFTKEDELSPSVEQPPDTKSEEVASKHESESSLPLRPFMPYTYSILESQCSSEVHLPLKKNKFLKEELLRSVRSNSLSELKKKVLMRKRSCSVDSKSGYLSKDSGTESVPASPLSSPKPTVQRKHSLFSRISLRYKEKSMSTNEIVPTPKSPSTIINTHKNTFHHSADCLKLSEDFVNSDDDIQSDFKDSPVSSPMKRSSSVPCRTVISVTSSAARNQDSIAEMNDLNKEGPSENKLEEDDPVQRKYSLDSHERKQRTSQNNVSNCDNMYRQDCADERDTVMEMQGILRRTHTHGDRSTTSSCSSSDISDYMESLSFISRSSSSSSGSADYMRSEDIYKIASRPPPKILAPGIHHTKIFNPSAEDSVNVLDGSESSSSSSSCQERNRQDSHSKPRNSRSSTSSSSSLSTSPSVTDYSSSSTSSPPCLNGVIKQQIEERKLAKVITRQPISSVVVVPSEVNSDENLT